MRLLAILLALALIVLIPFLIWGGSIESFFNEGRAVDWLQDWGAHAGVGLLSIDILVPIPSTVIMSALGVVYGVLLGGLLAAAGIVSSALLGYGLCRLFGESMAGRLLGEEGYRRAHRVFSQGGGWLVGISRWVPIVAEMVACMAGLSRMPFMRFLASATVGAAPMAFAFAWVGWAGKEAPLAAFLISALVPPCIWLAVRPIIRRLEGRGKP